MDKICIFFSCRIHYYEIDSKFLFLQFCACVWLKLCPFFIWLVDKLTWSCGFLTCEMVGVDMRVWKCLCVVVDLNLVCLFVWMDDNYLILPKAAAFKSCI